jgi:anti-sigma regulatory factor (Ser/Thr protein kinase)
MNPVGNMEARFPGKLESLPQLHEAVARFCGSHDVRPDVAFKIDLALEEVFSNIVRHGYGDGRSHEIAVRLERLRGRVRIQVDDDGRPFDPLQAPEADIAAPLDKRRPGGLGIHLVRRLLDQVRYQRRATGNRLILVKRLGAEERAT